MEILEKYIKDMEADLKIDEFSIKDASLKAPGKKHFWVGRLINHKRNIIKLEAEKEDMRKKIMVEMHAKSPIKLSTSVTWKSAEDNDIMRKLNTQIEEEKLIVEFLEKCEKIFSSLTYDIKNIIDIMKLEQL